MKLVIIAAGQGKRIRSITAESPKTLLKINGRTLLETLFENCLHVGISDVVVVTGYQTKEIEGFIHNLRMALNIQTVYNPDWNLENGMSILAAKDTISAHETFIVSMSDHFYGPDLLEQVVKINLANNTACVALDFNKDDIFDIDDDNKYDVKYKREPFEEIIDLDIVNPKTKQLESDENLKLKYSVKELDSENVLSVFLVNDREQEEKSRSFVTDCIFQAKIILSSIDNEEKIFARFS